MATKKKKKAAKKKTTKKKASKKNEILGFALDVLKGAMTKPLPIAIIESVNKKRNS
ncbi:MAG: hypothetical protein V3S46_01730 [Nitrospinota bacterium]